MAKSRKKFVREVAGEGDSHGGFMFTAGEKAAHLDCFLSLIYFIVTTPWRMKR
jgi:hypothetical protein